MDKKEALKILINETLLLTDEQKKKLVENIEKMDEETIQQFGHLLAVAKKVGMEKSLEQTRKLEEQLAEVKPDLT